MATFADENGKEVEIPTLEQRGDYLVVRTLEDVALLLQSMGWETENDFTHDTGATFAELLNQPFFIVNNRIYTAL